jgi:hypothetical protein
MTEKIANQMQMTTVTAVTQMNKMMKTTKITYSVRVQNASRYVIESKYVTKRAT